MARLEVNGIENVSLGFEKLSELPDALLEDMLLAEAEVVEKAQKRKGIAYGVHLSGVTLASITHGRMQRAKGGGRVMQVYPGAKNSEGNTNAEVAFINEYGKRGQAARPFIRDANEEAAEPAVSAAEAVYDGWLKKHNL